MPNYSLPALARNQLSCREMTSTRSRGSALTLLFCGLLLLVSCGGRTHQNVGGESNWLQSCSRDTDCDTGSCWCSVCTATCDRDRDCAARGGGQCTSNAALDSTICPGAFPDESVCLAEPRTPDRSDAEVDADVPSAPSVPNASLPDPDVPRVPSGDAAVDARVETTPDRSQCSFEFLGYWERCEGPQDADELAGATSAIDCMIACQQEPDCVGFNEYFWQGEGPEAGCALVRDSCDNPTEEVYYEEDAGRGFRIRCDKPEPANYIRSVADWQAELAEPGLRLGPESECVFTVLNGDTCEDFGILEFEPSRGDTLQECLEACDAMPECTAVVDWWTGEPTGYECVLYSSTCDNPYDSIDDLRTYVKKCASSG